MEQKSPSLCMFSPSCHFSTDLAHSGLEDALLFQRWLRSTPTVAPV